MTAPTLEAAAAKAARSGRTETRPLRSAAAQLSERATRERLKSAGIQVVEGSEFGTLLMRIPGLTLALVPDARGDGPSRPELVHNAKVDLIAELKRRPEAAQGIIYMPANTRILPDPEGAAAMAESRLSYEVAASASDEVDGAVSFLESWLAHRKRAREQRQHAAQQLRARLASSS